MSFFFAPAPGPGGSHSFCPGRQAARSAKSRAARLTLTGPYAQKRQNTAKIATTHTGTAMSTGRRFYYGESGDPAKTTYSRMTFLSRDPSSCKLRANAGARAYA